ncbi:TerB family tellurite resistance protein [Hymenobacter sp. BRD67]|uniref:TerB family tellurite resistance protein n=1 Tax=Hymenobacter sp. BRD67 TaxID=2675877 RepID=UPI001564DFE3|nr:TerB family tellurite resistance protein [Hymenobacter sp. BRD67]QKG54388.1 TerB family tellurite resistance protein [Hymenobacter sp. BRD67]
METQLLQNYSEPEKTAYLSAIASLATADRQATPTQIEFLQHLTQQAGLSAGSAQQVLQAAQDPNNQTVQQSLDQLKSSDLRYSLVTDLISFARVDGTYSPGEEEMVGKMAAYLGVNPDQKQALENVVDQAASVPHDPQDPSKQGFLSGLGDKLSSVGIPKNALMAGLLGVVAPMVISRVIGGGGTSQGQPSGTLGGLLGGAMGNLGDKARWAVCWAACSAAGCWAACLAAATARPANTRSRARWAAAASAPLCRCWAAWAGSQTRSPPARGRRHHG